jgi:hypothetical protein
VRNGTATTARIGTSDLRERRGMNLRLPWRKPRRQRDHAQRFTRADTTATGGSIFVAEGRVNPADLIEHIIHESGMPGLGRISEAQPLLRRGTQAVTAEPKQLTGGVSTDETNNAMTPSQSFSPRIYLGKKAVRMAL